MASPPGFLLLKDGKLDYSARTLIMGVLNVTPDSFSDGGRFYDPIRALQHGLKLAQDGADIIDVGGESTRPGAPALPMGEELKRVIPVIEGLVKEVDVPISIDTYKSEVAERALDVGASMVNDISAMRFDPQIADVIVKHQAPVILMHMKGTPRDMQVDPQYDNLMEEIGAFLQERVDWAEQKGVAPEKIIVDPGIGFGKRLEHNLLIHRELSSLKFLGKPILLGSSRKSFIGQVLRVKEDQREEGTAAAVAIGIWRGAQIVRVHDVARMASVVRMTDAILRGAA